MIDEYKWFEGEIVKIVLESETSYFCRPVPNQEVKQRLTIHKDGRVSLTRYYTDDFTTDPPLNERKIMRRYKNKPTGEVIDCIVRYFSSLPLELEIICDAGTWSIVIEYKDGKKWRYYGSLGEKMKLDGSNLSSLIRKTLEMPELWVFDEGEDDLEEDGIS